jgi:TonB family protein
MIAQLKSQGRDRFAGARSWDTARCLCQAIQANPSLPRDDEDFAWLMYSGVFQSTGEYLKLFPNGKHAAEARGGLRKTRTAPSPCVETPDPGVPGEIVGGVPGGIPGGVIGGVLGTDSLPPTRPAAPQVQAIRIGQNVARSKLLTEVPPVYPALAKQARIQGTVRFTVQIGTAGRVESIQLISGHPLLVSAAQDAVKQWVYQPTLLNGEPVRVETQLDVVFRLE